MVRSRGSGKKLDQHHVRLHLYEMNLPAYRTLSCDARALLIELRSLYSGRENEVFLSLRDMQERLNISQKPAQNARDELLVRGWIVELEKGSFSRKGGKATVFALTHVPMDRFERGVAPKLYLKWQQGIDFTKNAVVKSTAIGSQNAYAQPTERRPPAMGGSQDAYRSSKNPRSAVVELDAQVYVPPEVASAHAEVTAFDVLVASASASVSSRPRSSNRAHEVGGESLARASEQFGDGVESKSPAGLKESRVGHSVACKCGGRTHRRDAKAGLATLAWQECGCCGRADRHQMDDGAGNTLIGQAAKTCFADLEREAHAPALEATRKAIGRKR